MTSLSTSSFGGLPDGTPVERLLLDDGQVSVALLTYGAVIQQLRAPDRDGRQADVVLGFDDLGGYRTGQPYHGAIVGRFANRIGEARFDLDGRLYRLEANDGPNHLHGGSGGFHARVWRAEPLDDVLGVRLRLDSPDGDQGYPAALEAVVEYRLQDGRLTIDYAATNTEPAGGVSTVVNLTNHAYFNLAGHAAGSVGDHLVEVPAGRVLRSGPGLIPTGEIMAVDGTPLDLRTARRLADDWDSSHEQIAGAGGYDHTWVLEDARSGSLTLAARVSEPTSGRVLEVHTDQPGVHVYSGNMMKPLFTGKQGRRYGRRDGLCIETQHFPDSPNRPQFPSTVLAAGRTFGTTTSFTFATSAG